MNIYVIVEGEVSEKQIYREWITYVNPSLTFAAEIEEVTHNNFMIIHGGGYPQYFSVIENAIKDVKNLKTADGSPLFDRLVISADSEEYTYEEKREEILNRIKKFMEKEKISLEYKIIVQHFCLECWGLGNRKIISPSKKSLDLLRYTTHYDVRNQDPELLVPFTGETLTRAQHASKYLRAALINKYDNLTYTKSNPRALMNKSYFNQLLSRLNDTKHIKSFNDFIEAFS
ncbi:TPA: hypothetical protein ACRUL4_002499 [Legionella pneumophila]|nr:hypothetical protein [Legionella pneumophila]HAT1883614.1 hypothetical protein [Legionella pneumophila]HAT2115334.1 hypothetical protein [Legionella pneumophila]HAT8721531.1 hypothetical protein [Legionella pneumophila]